MKARILIISERPEDIQIAEFLAFANDLGVAQVSNTSQLRHALAEFPESLVFWDAEDPIKIVSIAVMLAKSVPPERIFAITDETANSYPHLAQYAVFAHHLLRRYDEPAPTLLARIVGATLRGNHLGLARYFPEGAASRKITLTRSSQKTAAVEAIQSFFTKLNVTSRLSSLLAQAVDELLMNAIFDAPVLPNGLPLRRGTDRTADFELIDRENVFVEVASGDDYVGINVTDLFGSLKRDVLMQFLGQDYRDADYVVNEMDPGAGLGLHGIVQSGLSVLFVCEPGKRTEVMIFFHKNSTYREFRGGFRFLSVIAP